jgi:hypothetical protein
MKNLIIFFLLLFSTLHLYSQIKQQPNDIWQAKEFSKDISLFRAKSYLFQYVLGANEKTIEFSVIPLAAASSGELTTLIYKCESLGKEGLILGFYGDYWNKSGVLYQGYAFKSLDKNTATQFLEKLSKEMEVHENFLKSDKDNNNIFFKYEDMEVLIWFDTTYKLRIFWNNFDSTWEYLAFSKSKRRFERNL